MKLRPGSRFGPYEVLAPLGVGGMGEVYRARDPRLGREVALKILPEELARSGDFLARFEQEARAASALNHPNIITIYEVLQVEGVPGIAMELVTGTSLKEILEGGPLPSKKTLDYAVQIADGLAAAHERGILHRDLKPGNLMVTKEGFVKILDFGLAKLAFGDPGGDNELTQPNMVVGTAGYVSPEQARARPLDSRSDQFSLGSVLYEMATGRRAFHRESTAETLSAVILEDPEPLATAAPRTPPPFRWIVDRCQSKEPAERYVSTRDLARELRAVRDHLSEITATAEIPAGTEARPGRISIAFAVGAALLGAALGSGVLALWLWRVPASEAPVIQNLTYAGHDSSPAASPDGKTVAFTSDRDGRPRIWLKQLSGGGEVALTTGPDDFARFSPDGGTLLFSRSEGSQTALYRTSLVGGEPRRLLEDVADGDWSPDGSHIAFVRWRNERGVMSSAVGVAAADGSAPREVTLIRGKVLLHPRWSPDGLWIAAQSVLQQAGLLQTIHLVRADGSRTRVLSPPATLGVISSVAWSGRGDEIIYSQAESAAGINTGSPARILKQEVESGRARTLLWSPNNSLVLDILGAGRIVFDTRSARENLREISAVVNEPGVSEPAGAGRWLTRGSSNDRQPRYSRDGDWLLFSSNRSGNLDLWKISTRTGAVRRLTDDRAEDWDPAFTPDGKRLLWSSNRTGHFEIWTADGEGSGARALTQDGVDAENPTATPDGRWVVYRSGNPAWPGVWKIHPDGTQATRLVKGTTGLPEVSPDGRYVLYLSNFRTQHVSIRVVLIEDGAAVPFEIAVENRRASIMAAFSVGRARWIPGGRAIAFVGQDERGTSGIFVQDFVPGRDTTSTRRALGGFDPETAAESFDIAPDGSRLAVAGWEQLFSVMTAEGLPGVTLPRRRG